MSNSDLVSVKSCPACGQDFSFVRNGPLDRFGSLYVGTDPDAKATFQYWNFQRKKFCSQSCATKFQHSESKRLGTPHAGRKPTLSTRIDNHGYVKVNRGTVLSKNGKMRPDYTLQHRDVMEAKLGRKLLPGENVHHVNGVKHDNRPENLELWTRPQPTGVRAGCQLQHFVPANSHEVNVTVVYG